MPVSGDDALPNGRATAPEPTRIHHPRRAARLGTSVREVVLMTSWAAIVVLEQALKLQQCFNCKLTAFSLTSGGEDYDQ